MCISQFRINKSFNLFLWIGQWSPECLHVIMNVSCCENISKILRKVSIVINILKIKLWHWWMLLWMSAVKEFMCIMSRKLWRWRMSAYHYECQQWENVYAWCLHSCDDDECLHVIMKVSNSSSSEKMYAHLSTGLRPCQSIANMSHLHSDINILSKFWVFR